MNQQHFADLYAVHCLVFLVVGHLYHASQFVAVGVDGAVAVVGVTAVVSVVAVINVVHLPAVDVAHWSVVVVVVVAAAAAAAAATIGRFVDVTEADVATVGAVGSKVAALAAVAVAVEMDFGVAGVVAATVVFAPVAAAVVLPGSANGLADDVAGFAV